MIHTLLAHILAEQYRVKAATSGEAALMVARKTLPGFDVNQGLFRMGGNHDLYIRILHSYEQTFRPFSDALLKLAGEGDTEQIMQQKCPAWRKRFSVMHLMRPA
jgi:hypothetical protein